MPLIPGSVAGALRLVPNGTLPPLFLHHSCYQPANHAEPATTLGQVGSTEEEVEAGLGPELSRIEPLSASWNRTLRKTATV